MVIAIGKRTPSEQLVGLFPVIDESGHSLGMQAAEFGKILRRLTAPGSAMTGDMQHLNVIMIVNRNGLNRAYSGHFRQRGRCANSDLRLTPMT